MNPDVPVQPIDVPILATATIVEQHIHHLIDSFEMSGARIYGVTIDDVERVHEERHDALRVSFLAQHPDVYELLQAPTSSLGRMFHAAAIVTTGWAAPLGPDGSVEGAPSEHLLRAPDDVVVDDGSATGSLAEAIHAYWYDPPVTQEA